LALYSPTNLAPNNTSEDATEPILFRWTYNGVGVEAIQTHFQVKIYKNSDNTLVHDSTKTASSNNFYTLSSTPLVNNNDYKFQVTVWSNASSANSNWVLFFCFERPTFTIGSLPSSTQTHEFSATYYSAQGVPLKTYRAYLFSENDLNNPISDSGNIYPETLITNGTVYYEVDGLETDETYYVQFVGLDQNNYELDTGQHEFSIVYNYPPAIPNLLVTEDKSNGTLILNWVDVQQKIAQVDGTFSYIDGLFNKSLQLDTNSKLLFTEPFLDGFTLYFWVKLPNDYSGNLVQFGDNMIGMKIFVDPSKRFGIKCGEFVSIGREIFSEDNIFNNWILIGVQNGTLIVKGSIFEEVLNVV